MIYRETATEIILKALLYKTLSYKEVDRILRKHKKYKDTTEASIRSTLSRLKKKKLTTKTLTGWSASQLAIATLLDRGRFNRSSHQTTQKNKPKMIVMYDIPEDLRSKRNRMRENLAILGFKQKQKSVWIGPAPLPREFINYLSELGLLKYTNFFRVKEEDIV